jgi:hypothetical protein
LPLSQPPRNGGNIIPHDHPDILNTDEVIRRISDEQLVTVEGVRRISSIAFKPSGGPDGGMSIDLKASIESAGLDPKQYVSTPKWIGSVILPVSVPRNQGLLVGYEPIPGNDHHGEVWGKFSNGKSKAMQRACQWFVPIAGVATA